MCSDILRWFCLSLMANDVEYIFRCLFAICISSLAKWLFVSFEHLLIRLFLLLLLSFKSSLYIWANSPLSDISFANIKKIKNIIKAMGLSIRSLNVCLIEDWGRISELSPFSPAHTQFYSTSQSCLSFLHNTYRLSHIMHLFGYLFIIYTHTI